MTVKSHSHISMYNCLFVSKNVNGPLKIKMVFLYDKCVFVLDNFELIFCFLLHIKIMLTILDFLLIHVHSCCLLHVYNFIMHSNFKGMFYSPRFDCNIVIEEMYIHKKEMASCVFLIYSWLALCIFFLLLRHSIINCHFYGVNRSKREKKVFQIR